MTESSWKFSIKQKEEAILYYKKFGVVGFHDLLNSEDLNAILNGINEAIENGDLKYNEDKFEAYQNDIIFSHPILEKLVNNKRICDITRDHSHHRPTQIKKSVEILSLSPDKVLVIGDRIHDVKSAKQVGCSAILFNKDKLHTFEECQVISELFELAEIDFS